ncbi:unnamed protein product [Lota lota]
MPNYAVSTDTERLIGDSAKHQGALNPVNSVFDAKRLIGRMFDDPRGGKSKMEVEYKGEIKHFFPEEISSMALTKMRAISEAFLGKVDPATS